MFLLLPAGSHSSSRLLELRLSTLPTARPGRGIRSRNPVFRNKTGLIVRGTLGHQKEAAIAQNGPQLAPRADHEVPKPCSSASESTTQLHALKGSLLGATKDTPALPITSDADVEASYSGLDDSLGLEAGVIPKSRLQAADPTSSGAQASTSGRGGRAAYATAAGSLLYPPAQRSHIRESW